MEATLYYRPKVLQIGVLKDAILKAVGAELGPESKIKILYPRNPSPGVTDIVELDAGSLGPIVDLDTVDFTVRASSSRPGCYDEVYFRFYAAAKGKAFYIYAGSEGSYRCLEQIVASLSLEQTELEFPQLDELDSLPARVAALEKIAKDAGSNPKCFISFKFDDPEMVAPVNRLKRLLAAVHVEFLTGEQFEPRRIEDKVKARLRADVDFLIAVISKRGESKWIRDELADANSRELWIMVLLEDGATFEKGIFGTLEYIRYTVAIEQTFPEVLEGINFVRAEIATRRSTKG